MDPFRARLAGLGGISTKIQIQTRDASELLLLHFMALNLNVVSTTLFRLVTHFLRTHMKERSSNVAKSVVIVPFVSVGSPSYTNLFFALSIFLGSVHSSLSHNDDQ